MDNTLQKAKTQKHILNRLFIGLMAFVELLLVIILAISILKMFSGEISIFSMIALDLILLWLGLIIGYLAWGIYFYNINLGLTNESWTSIKASKDKQEKFREAGIEDTTGSKSDYPEENIYKDESLGLPPGTVRATLTLTLMVGSLSLFIYSMGHTQIQEGNSFIYDSFEFFKTAFLMMIAFYFGSRSLELLSAKGKENIITKRFVNSDTLTPADNIPTTKGNVEETTPNVQEKQVTPAQSTTRFASTSIAAKPPMSTLSALKQVLKEKSTFQPVEEEKEITKAIELEISNKVLTNNEIIAIAKDKNIDPAALLAVTAVESGKSGFLPDGRPKILFEGHKFWKNLKDFQNRGIIDFGPEKFAANYPEILYPSWTKKYYVGGAGEYTRLDKAILIHRDSALMSASWGKFQILGENYKIAGFDSVEKFVEAHKLSEKEHFESFLNFIVNTKRDGKSLLEYLNEKNWQKFARGYNGPAYSENKYDLKLEEKYAEYSASINQNIRATMNRKSQNNLQTLGELKIQDNDQEIFTCKTLELPWKNNSQNISCIPAGKYRVIKRFSDQYQHHFHILNVPGRSMILIHTGNYYSQTKGCILVGTAISDINSDGIQDVTSSKLAMSKLNQILPDKFEISIEDHA